MGVVVVVECWKLAMECMYVGLVIATTQIILDINWLYHKAVGLWGYGLNSSDSQQDQTWALFNIASNLWVQWKAVIAWRSEWLLDFHEGFLIGGGIGSNCDSVYLMHQI
jgi:hypothetical protein